jgi:flagellar assembly protein FliH
MSSKLLRGASIATEQMAWRQVDSSEAIAGESQSPSSYISEPGLPAGGSRAAGEIEQRLQTAHQQGFEAGQAAVRQSLAQPLEAMQMKLARSIEELSGSRLRYRREAEQDVVALALAVARRILHRELTMVPEALLGLVKAALDKMEAREVHQARVSREDAPMVRQFLEQMGLPQRIEVIADPGIERGGVVLESSRGALDASVDTQLSEIERGFADLVRRSP